MNRADKLLAAKGMYEKYSSSQICNAINIVNTPFEYQLMKVYFNVLDKGEEVRKDVKQGTYKGKTAEDMEEYRLRILREMEDEEDDEEALEKLIKSAEELKEYSMALIYNEQHKKFCIIEIMCKVIENMVTAEVPLEVIRSYFPENLKEEVEFIEKTMKKSVEKSMMSCFYELIQEELITVEAAAEHMKMSVEEFTKKLNEVREEDGEGTS